MSAAARPADPGSAIAPTIRALQAEAISRRYARGRDNLQASLLATRRKALAPPPILTLSQWAAEYAHLSPETSAQTGRFTAYAYQIEIMDAITDPANSEVTVMKGARVGYTKILDHICGYFIHQDPSPILVVQPRVEDAEDYSATEIAPMLRDTPVLAAIAGDLKAKDSGQKLAKRMFRNGASIALVGANSPNPFRRITARIILCDEVDGYPVGGAGKDGDQLALAKKRGDTFWNRIFVKGSTPTIKGESRIEKEWLRSDQRKFFVSCPQCKQKQVLEFGGKDTAHGLKWDKDPEGNHLPETAYYLCRNSCIIYEDDKADMIAGGKFIATNPKGTHPGFHICQLYSLNVNASWSQIAEEWLEVRHDPLRRQTFYNLVLGEPYEERGDKALAEAKLLARREQWAAEVPDGVAVMTAGLDTQDDRVEIEFVGWGRDEESWSIAHEVVEGDPALISTWDTVDELLQRVWYRADGRPFTVSAACIDSGGHHTQRVYDFAKARLGRRIYAIKGESAVGGKRSPIWPAKKPTRRTRTQFRPVIIGVNAAKDVIRDRLHVEEAGPGYMHFPGDRDANYFAQMIAERLVTKWARGQKYRVWECPPGRANEALDCRVYAYAALCALIHFGLKLNRQADIVGVERGPGVPEGVPDAAVIAAAQGQPGRPPPPRTPPPARPPSPPRRRVRRSSMMD